MHFSIILVALLLAWSIRLLPIRSSHPSGYSWTMPLLQFLLPPLLLLSTAIAVNRMGMGGEMFGIPVGWLGCHLSLGFLLWAGAILLWRLGQAGRSLLFLRSCPLIEMGDTTGRILESSGLFAAQVGFWNSQLVVSRGLLSQLSPEQLDAVLAHEAAHRHYRDTFWFFVLGWIGSLTNWLPATHSLWEELLLYRELRADRRAAQQIDPLLLAESLLQVAQSTPVMPLLAGVAFSDETPLRLEQRVDALLSTETPVPRLPVCFWAALLLAGLPLLTPLLHHASLMHP